MDEEGSVARMWVKEAESEREIRPCPHPRSRSSDEGGAW